MEYVKECCMPRETKQIAFMCVNTVFFSRLLTKNWLLFATEYATRLHCIYHFTIRVTLLAFAYHLLLAIAFLLKGTLHTSCMTQRIPRTWNHHHHQREFVHMLNYLNWIQRSLCRFVQQTKKPESVFGFTLWSFCHWTFSQFTSYTSTTHTTLKHTKILCIFVLITAKVTTQRLQILVNKESRGEIQ